MCIDGLNVDNWFRGGDHELLVSQMTKINKVF